MLEKIVESLYLSTPEATLYHYTSLQGLLGIVRSKVFWASEIHYLNDGEELKTFEKQISKVILRYRETGNAHLYILEQFQGWLKSRISMGPMLFIASFTENGNLLSQWRGYCEYGKGVSIGFEPSALATTAGFANFEIGQCIYDAERQYKLAQIVVDFILEKSEEYKKPDHAVEHQSHHSLFQSMEPSILRSRH